MKNIIGLIIIGILLTGCAQRCPVLKKPEPVSATITMTKEQPKKVVKNGPRVSPPAKRVAPMAKSDAGRNSDPLADLFFGKHSVNGEPLK